MKAWLQCPKCQAIYYREDSDNKECITCGPTPLNLLEGRLILRCKTCGLTQNQLIYTKMEGRNEIKCQNSTCKGKIRAILIGAKKSTNAELAPPTSQSQNLPSRKLSDPSKSAVAGSNGTAAGRVLPSSPEAARRELIDNLANRPKISSPSKPVTPAVLGGPHPKDHPGLKPGDYLQINDDYVEVIEKLGTGGMGAVHKGKLVKSGQPVAIKEFFYTRYHDPETQENKCEHYWIREQTMIEIQSKSPEKSMHLIGSLKLTQFPVPEYYLFIEFIPGLPLEKWYLNRIKSISDLSISELRMYINNILMPIARHIYFVHEQGIVHRDLTVQNVMIIEDSQGVHPIVIDWGVAKQIGSEKIYNPRKPYYVSGTPEATGIRNRGTPPEVMAGFEPIAASDIYMLGHIMYFLFTGGRYCGTAATHEDFVLHPSDYNPDLHPDFNRLVEYMSQYEPADRMPNMVKVYEALQWLYSTSESLEFPDRAKNQFFLYCEYNDAFIPITPGKVLQLGRDEIIKAGSLHDYDGHLYYALIPLESGEFQLELFWDKNYLFLRDLHSKMGTFLNHLTMPNQQVFENVAIKGQNNVFIPLSDANINQTTIEIPFVAQDGITYRIPFKIVNTKNK